MQASREQMNTRYVGIVGAFSLSVLRLCTCFCPYPKAGLEVDLPPGM